MKQSNVKSEKSKVKDGRQTKGWLIIKIGFSSNKFVHSAAGGLTLLK
jgi:hypothetical protein